MAIKITTAIGTDKGITSEAYVRIADYQVSKYGSANFRLELFQTQEDSIPGNGMYPGAGAGIARNQQIGENLYVALTKVESKTRTVTHLVPVEIQETIQVPGPADENGEPTMVETPHTRIEMQEQEVEETFEVTVPDLSSLEEGTIFSFAYAHLKTKLEGLFGAENVVDC